MTSVIRPFLRDRLSRLASFLENLDLVEIWRRPTVRHTVTIRVHTVAAWSLGIYGVIHSLGVVWNPPPTGVEIARQQESFVALSKLIGYRAVLVMTHHMSWSIIYFVPVLCAVLVTWNLCKRAELQRAVKRTRDLFGH